MLLGSVLFSLASSQHYGAFVYPPVVSLAFSLSFPNMLYSKDLEQIIAKPGWLLPGCYQIFMAPPTVVISSPYCKGVSF